jgi:hypothetical protein
MESGAPVMHDRCCDGARGARRSAPNRGRSSGGRTRGAAALLAVVLGAVTVGGAGAARADLVLEGLPTVSVGYTDNAALVPPAVPGMQPPRSDEFGIVAGIARARVRKAHADHSLGYRLAETFYFHNRGPSSLSQELAWLSDLSLSPPTQLRLGASVAYGRTSNPTGVDTGAAGVAGAQLAISSNIISLGATEELVHIIGRRSRILQNLRFAGVHYLNAPGAFDGTFVVGAFGRGEHEVGQNLFSLELDVSDNIVPGNPGVSDQVLILQSLAGWRRDLGLAWWVELKAGALGVLDFHGTEIVEPAAVASLNYRQIYWFATLSGSQTATANLFIGAATISDQATLRLALPLARSERYLLAGYGGYTYARLIDDMGTRRGYDLRLAGASFTARSERLPIWVSLDYTYSHQFGNTYLPPDNIPDLERQTVLLTVGGAFTRGAAAPALFHGVLPGVVPIGESRPEDAGRSPEDLSAPQGTLDSGTGASGSPAAGGSGASGGSGNVKNVPR